MAGFNNVTDFYPQITGQLTVYPGPINQVTATVDNNVGTPYVEVTQTPTELGMDILFAFFNLKGEQGETGNGIQSIAKTATVGLVDTYTITYTDGTTSTFNVTNGAKGDTGNGIQSIAKTGTSGLVDTYTITFTNGQTTTFTVTNGAKGDTGETGNGIASIAKTSTSGLVDTYTITFTDGTTTTFDVTNGEDGTVTTDQLMEAIANQLPTDNASGSIASFPDGADDIPVKSLIAQIAPLQDLHGYDKPWPAGGGKNKIDPASFSTFPRTTNGITATLNSDGSFTLNGTATANSYIDIISYRYLANYGIFEAGVSYTFTGRYSENAYCMFGVDGSGTDYRPGPNGITMTFTAEQISSLRYRLLFFVANGTTLSNAVIKPMICLSTATDPTVFAPYSNICPISGWTGANITRCGKNLLPNIIYQNGEKQVILGQTSSATRDLFIKAGTYTITYEASSVLGTLYYNADGETNTSLGSVKSASLTLSKDCYIRFWIYNGSGVTASSVSNVRLNIGSTDLGYEAYNGTALPISWQTEAGTVYGGTLDVTTGVLTVTKASIDVGTSSLVTFENVGGLVVAGTLPFTIAGHNGSQNVLCDKYEVYPVTSWTIPVDKVIGVRTNDGFRFKNADYTTFDTLKAALVGVQLVYELATPQTYQLTPTEVKTLLGDNSIWADCGDVDVTYRADIAKYIAKQLAAVQALILENQ